LARSPALASYDGRSLAEKILEAIDAAMLGKATRISSRTPSSPVRDRAVYHVSDVTELMEAQKYTPGSSPQRSAPPTDSRHFKRHKFSFVAD
jgi:hypothetical protein